jgi:hypothetical protein
MATVTPNYSWPVPTSTDLVKDGATAIEALGDAIDATVFAIPAPGMVKLSTVSFSAVSSVSLPTNTFTSTYDNYVIYLNWTMSAGSSINMRYRASGTDATSADYYFAGISTVHNSATISSQRGSGVTAYTSSTNMSTSRNALKVEVLDPQSANPSKSIFQVATAGGFFETFGGVLSNSSQYDAVTFYPGSGTFTGTYSVFGVNK